MFRFALSHNWSGVTSTLIFSVVLMSTSITAQDHGGTLMFFFSDTDALDGVWYSAVSAMTLLFCVNLWVFVFVHEIPMQFWIEKSLARIMGLFRCSHTMNVWYNIFPFMLISHLVLPLAPRLSPEAPTTWRMLVLSRFFNFSFSYISSDITLFMAPVSKSVLILVFKLLFANIWNTVPVVGPNSSML